MLHHDYYPHGNTCFSLSPSPTPKIPRLLCLYWSPWPHQTDMNIAWENSAWDRPNWSFGWSVVDEAEPCTLAPFTAILLTTAFVLDQLGSWVFSLSQSHTALWLAKWGRDGECVEKGKNLLNWETEGSPRRQQGKFSINSTENELAN